MAWRLAGAGRVESSEEARVPPRRRPGGGRGRLAPSRGLYKCGERLLAQEDRRQDVGRRAGKDRQAGQA